MDNGEGSYRRFLDGDTAGFNELIEMYHDPLIYFINGFIHNTSVSEEIAEDAFAELIIHKNRFSFRSSFKTYLFSIARNKAVDYIRHISRRAALAENDGDIDGGKSLEARMLQDERARELHIALERINPEYAALLRLIYFEDMSAQEAGKVLGKGKRQIQNLLYRAKTSLKNAMEKEGFSYEE